MEQQSNNVGGQSMGMANSGPAQNNDAAQAPQFGTPAMQPAGNSPASPQLPVGTSPASSEGAQTTAMPAVKQNDVASTSLPDVAEDSDLIEKEWVEKAKSIVEKTQRDPFAQSLQLNQLKAEYLQKRYGKNVGSDGQES
jgi:hypothetical protein